MEAAGPPPDASGPPGPGTCTVHLADARAMGAVADGSVALVVTSPPYPHVAMWDGAFRALGATDWQGQHAVLDAVWAEVARALMPGGIACVVVGDALRKVEGSFQLFPNHARVMDALARLGLMALPYILWKKPTNRPNAFLGSGFLPPNAYVTLDCEFILVFRKGPLRAFPPHDGRRAASRYTKAERDRWFSQVWELPGARQRQAGVGRRTAAFPPEVPARLVRMFSVEGDLVLDPFAGTGTALAEAVRAGRDAVGYEVDPALRGAIEAAVARAGAHCRFSGPEPNG
ncbi:MAG TPA: site-specific DNA-methyltransferase [Candidatus Thermoplasmatota archaeon]